jgi:hypothetical protein
MIPFYKFLGYGIRIGKSRLYYGLGQRRHHLRIVGVLASCQMPVWGMRAGGQHIGHQPAVYAFYLIVRQKFKGHAEGIAYRSPYQTARKPVGQSVHQYSIFTAWPVSCDLNAASMTDMV